MKSKQKRTLAAIPASILSLTLLFGCAPKGEPQTAQSNPTIQAEFKTRAVRTSSGGSDILPTPTTYVTEKEGDQARFDSYVWSVKKLKENIKNVIVLDARTAGDYDKGHLPGAVQAHWKDWSNMDVSQGSGQWALILSAKSLASKLAALGIDGKKPVVIYNDPLNGSGEEGRQLWALRYYGLTNTYILNGGITAWEKAGYETTKTKPSVKAVTAPTLKANDALFASTEYVAAHLSTDIILDTRSDQEFAGQTNNGEKSKGRIPNANHVWFKDFYHSDGTLLTPAETRARLEPIGITTDKPVITYCTGGIRAALSAIVLLSAGYTNVRNYNASFSGWAGTNQNIDTSVFSNLSVVNN